MILNLMGSTPVRSTPKKMPEILERSDFSRVSGIFMWLFYRVELCVICEIIKIATCYPLTLS